MNYPDSIIFVADKLKLPVEVVRKAYESYWLFVRETISELPLKSELSEEEFNELRTNFNIPSIGKLSCTYDRYKAVKGKQKYLDTLRDDSKGKEN